MMLRTKFLKSEPRGIQRKPKLFKGFDTFPDPTNIKEVDKVSFKPFKKKTMKRKGSKIVSARKITRKGKTPRVKRKKLSKAAFYRSWGIYPGTWIRYSGIKGVYWFWFSRSIRERDYKEHGGLCITCDKYVEKGSDQACHIFAASSCGFYLLFEPMNVHLGHSKCNNPRFTPSSGVWNALNMEKRYGVGTIARLATLKEIKTKEWNRAKYEEEINKLPAYKNYLISLQ